ncbi:MAG: transcription termination factor NusA [Candidatus Paceibacterota bacterium]
MIDLKALKSSLEQLEEERNIPKEKILEAIEDSLTAAYKKDYGKKGQIIRAHFDTDTGKIEFFQVKIVVDPDQVRLDEEDKTDDEDERPRFNEEHHIFLADAKKIKKDAKPDDELIFPLETKDDYGRIAAQTAKQVIIQRLREAEKVSVMGEYSDKEGEITSGKVQKIERGNVFVDMGRVTGLLPHEEQIPGEYYRQGERIRAYLYLVEETPRGINLKLSRSHPKFVEKLFEIEAPEIAEGLVEIKSIAREAGVRTKIAVFSHDDGIDPVGSCVGQRGSRVTTIISELGGEKIDIIEWSESSEEFISNALSPAKILDITLDKEVGTATVLVAPDQFSLAVGKGGQNVRLAAKLTGWKIDIKSPETSEEEVVSPAEAEVDTSELPTDDPTTNQDKNDDTETEEKDGETSSEEIAENQEEPETAPTEDPGTEKSADQESNIEEEPKG